MWIKYDPNPCKNSYNDCVIRAISKVLNRSWRDVYISLFVEGYLRCEVPTTNYIWEEYLYDFGFVRHMIDPIRVVDFCKINNSGTYVLCTGTHVIASIDGDYFDTADSGYEVITYFLRKEN